MRYILIGMVVLVASFAQAQHSVKLTWTASTTPSVSYHVYRATVSGGPYAQVSTGNVACCTYTDTTVSNGVTYYFVVRSFDGTVESADSNQVTTVIPQAPAPPTALTGVVQ